MRQNTETRPALGEGSTPGPWEWQKDLHGFQSLVSASVKDTNGKYTWNHRVLAGNGCAGATCSDVDVEEPDARLLAQAWRIPELVKLLTQAEHKLSVQMGVGIGELRAEIQAVLADLEADS